MAGLGKRPSHFRLALAERHSQFFRTREEPSKNVVGALLVGLVVGPTLGAFGFGKQVFGQSHVRSGARPENVVGALFGSLSRSHECRFEKWVRVFPPLSRPSQKPLWGGGPVPPVFPKLV